MSALSAAWQEEHGAKPARGRVAKSDEDIPTMVRKALSDNFAGWSEGEIYHIKHNGMSLYDTLYAAKQEWVKSKHVKHGPFFYENLRSKYPCESRPWNQLKIPSLDDVPPALLDALEARLHHKKGPLIALTEAQSESQAKCLMIALSKLRPATSQQQLKVALSLPSGRPIATPTIFFGGFRENAVVLSEKWFFFWVFGLVLGVLT